MSPVADMLLIIGPTAERSAMGTKQSMDLLAMTEPPRALRSYTAPPRR